MFVKFGVKLVFDIKTVKLVALPLYSRLVLFWGR